MRDLAPSEFGAGNAFAINDSGQVAGGISGATSDAVLWNTAQGTEQHLGYLPGGTNSDGEGINSEGQVVGFSDVVVDQQQDHQAHAFFWDPTTQQMRDLETLEGATGYSYARGINDSGEVVGNSEIAAPGNPNDYHAFLWTNKSGMVDLGTLPGSVQSAAWAIDSYGDVVGAASDINHAFLWTPDIPNGTTGKMIDLSSAGPPADAAYGINDNGQVVGFNFGPGGFVWDSTNGVQNLTGLIMPPTNFFMSAAYGINDAGQIVGFGSYLPNGPSGAALLTPIPGAIGKGRPAPFARSEIGQVLGSFSHANSPTALDDLFSSIRQEDVGPVPRSQEVRAANESVPPQSLALGLAHVGHVKDAGIPGPDGSDNPLDLLAAREMIRLE